MARITIPTRDQAPAASKAILDGVNAQLGRVPNFFRAISLSPAVIEAHGALGKALGRTLDAKTRERIALATAAVNGCEYCNAAHSFTSFNFAHLAPEEIVSARRGRSADPKAAGAVAFARKVAETRGKVSDIDLAEVRELGFSDAQIVEIVALVAENFFTNLINNVVETDVDFPLIDAARAA